MNNNFDNVCCTGCNKAVAVAPYQIMHLQCTACGMVESNSKMFFNYNTATNVLHSLMQCKRCNTLDIQKNFITIECDGCGAKTVMGRTDNNYGVSLVQTYVAGVAAGLLGCYAVYFFGKLIYDK